MTYTLRNRLGKRLLALGTAAALLLSCAACQSPSETGESQEAKGRYVETALPLPQNTNPYALGEMDGALRLLCDKGVYQSTDGGNAWEKQDIPALEPFFSGGKALEFSQGCWSQDGSLIFSACDTAGAMEYHYYVLSKDGELRELPIQLPEIKLDDSDSLTMDLDDLQGEGSPESESAGSAEVDESGGAISSSFQNTLSDCQFLPDGSIAGRSLEGKIYHIDQNTGAILHTLTPAQEEGFYDSFAVTKSVLAAYSGFNSNGMDLYDLNTWEKKESDPVLDSFLSGGSSDSTGENSAVNSESGSESVDYSTFFSFSGGGSYSSLANFTQFFTSPGEDVLYICKNSGVYRHILGGSTVEQLINGSMSSLATPTFHLDQMLKTSSDSFKALYFDETSAGGLALMSYDFDPEISAVPAAELTICSLYDCAELRQFIAMYQKVHPDVYINLETPMENGGAMTSSDALRALNANIMAGKGPDLLFLDGDGAADGENYANKGLLADITDVVDEARKRGDILDNVVSSYQKDGKDFIVPTRFTVPILVGKKEQVEAVSGLDSLAQSVEALRKANPGEGPITGLNRAFSLIDDLFPACYPSWIQEDGALSREKLTEFLELCGRILKAENQDQPMDENGVPIALSYALSYDSELLGIDLLSSQAQLVVQNMSSVYGCACLSAVLKKSPDCSYGALNGQSGEKVFRPRDLIGINAKSSQIDAAKDFVRFLLSQEGQQHSQGMGLPVNTQALENLLQDYKLSGQGVGVSSWDGKIVDLTLRALTQEESGRLIQTLSSLDTPITIQRVVWDAVTEQGAACLTGETSVEAAVDEILRQVNLYLSES